MNKVFKKNGKKIIINSIISSIIITIIVYLIVGPFNNDFIKLMQSISEQRNAITFALLLFPAILIIHLCINIAQEIIHKGR